MSKCECKSESEYMLEKQRVLESWERELETNEQGVDFLAVLAIEKMKKEIDEYKAKLN